jgi:hypothetical protein
MFEPYLYRGQAARPNVAVGYRDRQAGAGDLFVLGNPIVTCPQTSLFVVVSYSMNPLRRPVGITHQLHGVVL